MRPALILLAGLALVGCAARMRPLHRYDDRWTGSMEIGMRRVPVDVALWVLRHDVTRMTTPYDRHVFGEVGVDGLGPLAASGTVSHYAWTERGRTTYAPLAEREFVELRVEGPGGMIASAEDRPGAGESYLAAYRMVLDAVHAEAAPDEAGDYSVLLVGELRGQSLAGKVLVVESRTGDCERHEGDRCTMWAVESEERAVGTFRVTRAGPAGVASRGDDFLETDTYRFVRREEGTSGVSWSVTLRAPPHVPRPDVPVLQGASPSSP